jgi:hypothetical protein
MSAVPAVQGLKRGREEIVCVRVAFTDCYVAIACCVLRCDSDVTVCASLGEACEV